MKHSDAVVLMRGMMFAVQKCQSIALENEYPELTRWISGDKNCLPALVKIDDRIQSGGMMTRGEFRNLRYIANNLCPMIGIQMASNGLDMPDIQIGERQNGWETK